MYRHCSAPFVRKRALLLFVRTFAPLSSLRSSIHCALRALLAGASTVYLRGIFHFVEDSTPVHPGIRLRGFPRAVFDFAVHYCENRSSTTRRPAFGGPTSPVCFRTVSCK